MNIVTNTLVTLLELLGLLLHEPLPRVSPEERLSRVRRVSLVHWFLKLVHSRTVTNSKTFLQLSLDISDYSLASPQLKHHKFHNCSLALFS